ncbi:hypothetical protein CR513_35161, partial [Mucuna pruriens]
MGEKLKGKRQRCSSPSGSVEKKLEAAIRTSGTDDNAAPSPSPSNLSGPEAAPWTPCNAIPSIIDGQQTPFSESSTKGRSGQMLEAGSGVTVYLNTEGGEYVLRINRRSIPSSSHENKVEEAKQMAQSAGMLFLQAEILRDMAEQLLAQSRATLQYEFRKPAPQNTPNQYFLG